MTGTTPLARRTDGTLDAAAFAAEAERMTNQALLEEWLALYHPDAVADWVVDGAAQRYAGIDAIRPAATVLAEVWRACRLRVRKIPQCADATTVVLTWEGGFRGRANQLGTEIWTFRGDRVARHQMYGYLDVRPRSSLWARTRVLLTDPRTAVGVLTREARR
ncbi:nuclear transport factor 2 family protein [Actinomadura opuntiae]|uniref:nuclear transport factor 2 family protein n=1 Tax=Actinomadura sp. OS1-43 TaxID=604315 RepID=UPI00255ACDAF|nr:nuclear transport factor 2 family protein [Actinomadura sp. OS1-43]MDL4817341.1 nuclear transport factor 2 family protein [Actinomadura sp. OS1-43]